MDLKWGKNRPVTSLNIGNGNVTTLKEIYYKVFGYYQNTYSSAFSETTSNNYFRTVKPFIKHIHSKLKIIFDSCLKI